MQVCFPILPLAKIIDQRCVSLVLRWAWGPSNWPSHHACSHNPSSDNTSTHHQGTDDTSRNDPACRYDRTHQLHARIPDPPRGTESARSTNQTSQQERWCAGTIRTTTCPWRWSWQSTCATSIAMTWQAFRSICGIRITKEPIVITADRSWLPTAVECKKIETAKRYVYTIRKLIWSPWAFGNWAHSFASTLVQNGLLDGHPARVAVQKAILCHTFLCVAQGNQSKRNSSITNRCTFKVVHNSPLRAHAERV